MPADPSQIASKGVIGMLQARAKRQKAEIDVATSREQEAAIARSSVAAAMAAIQERKQAQQEAIAKQSENQPPPPEMIPPTVDVSGIPQRPSVNMNALASGADILNQVSGGAQVQRTSGNLPNPAIGPGINPAAPPPGSPPGTPPTAVGATPPAPGQQSQGAGATPITNKIEGWQRALRGVAAVGMLANRNFGGAASLGEQAISGKEVVGYQQPPTPQEIGQKAAPAVAELMQMGYEAKTPEEAAAAQQAQQQYMDLFKAQYGEEAAFEATVAAGNLMLKAEWDRQQAVKLAEAKADETMDPVKKILKKYAAGEKLDPNEQRILDWKLKSGQTNITVNTGGQLEKGMRLKVQQEYNNGLTLLNMLNDVDRTYYPEFYRMGASAQHKIDELRIRAGEKLSPSEMDTFNKYVDHQQYLDLFKQDRVRTIAGATMSAAEIDLALAPLVRGGLDEKTARRFIDNLKDNYSLSLYRHFKLLQKGIEDPKESGVSLAQTKDMVVRDANERMAELTKQGMNPDAALTMVDSELRGGFGIDIYRIKGLPRKGQTPMSTQ